MSYDVDEKKPNVRLRKITKDRLKNIALYYLQRFETTQAKLREVLKRRVDNYAFYFPEFDRAAAYVWIEEILQDCVRYQYIDDTRFAKLKIQDYLNAGKSEKYIRLKMAEKGVDETVVDEILASQNFNPFENALKLARKKHIGPFRQEKNKSDYFQKDMAVLARAGFDYDVVKKVMDFSPED